MYIGLPERFVLALTSVCPSPVSRGEEEGQQRQQHLLLSGRTPSSPIPWAHLQLHGCRLAMLPCPNTVIAQDMVALGWASGSSCVEVLLGHLFPALLVRPNLCVMKARGCCAPVMGVSTWH